MGDLHPLWPSRRSGGINHVGKLLRQRLSRRASEGLAQSAGAGTGGEVLDTQEPGAGRRQRANQLLSVRTKATWNLPGSTQHAAEDWSDRSADKPRRPSRRPAGWQSDRESAPGKPRPATRPPRRHLQKTGNPVRPLIQLGIGHTAPGKGDRDGLRLRLVSSSKDVSTDVKMGP